MKTSLRLLLSGAFLALILPVYSQSSAILEEYIRTGLANNAGLRQQSLDVQKSREAIRQAEGLFYPTLSFSATYTMAKGGRSIDLPVGETSAGFYRLAD